jgi:hypothetical protein
VPVVCTLRDTPKDAERKRLVVWKYNFRQHIFDLHPSYAAPGWPAKDDVHEARDIEGGELFVPNNLAILLDFGEHEESVCGVSRSTPWSSIASQASKRPREEEEDDDDDEDDHPSNRPAR